MNYKEKYEQALERAKYALTTDMDNSGHWAVNYIFPELREDSNERIKKEIVDFIISSNKYGTNERCEAWLNWLESNPYSGVSFEYNGNIWGMCARDNGVDILLNKQLFKHLEKQGEQTTDKIEPKFKVGDWITDGCVGGQITSIEENYPCYKISDFMGGINTSIPFTIQDNYHLWTINDAKDGDVLCTYECDKPKTVFILKGAPKKHYALSYHCYYNIMYPHFDSDSENGCLAPKDENVKPATKEQRELLFQKMKAAGYEWRQEEKKLIKINEPKFKVGDWITTTDEEGNVTTEKIIEFCGDKVRLIDTNGFYTLWPKHELNYYHLWTINDAKDGDVLATDYFIFIYKNIDSENGVHYYCQYEISKHQDDEQFDIALPQSLMGRVNSGMHYKPATEEQRELLFEKMKQAGYKWRQEEKKLIKINEPKFKVGDWVVKQNGESFWNGDCAAQITNITDHGEHWLNIGCWIEAEKIRLWSINDAKDGDILVTEDYIFIFKYILHGGVHLYCYYNFDDEEFDSDIPDVVIGNIHDKGIHFRPATKEQRELLFEKMKESGYKLDKELIK